jgi:predicted SAM-dependent methyltransferase
MRAQIRRRLAALNQVLALDRLLAAVNQVPASARLRRRLAKEMRPLRVEVGAGHRHLDGWICTDVLWNSKYYLDMTKPWPVEPGAVQYVYGDNVIEHLTLAQGRSMLRNARAAMVAGGTIRLATPDLGRIANLYVQGPRKEVERLMVWHRRHDRLAEHPGDLLRIAFTAWGHHVGYLYDLPSLKAELERAGFEQVRPCSTSRSADPVLRGLENRTDEETDIQLVVEATANALRTDR